MVDIMLANGRKSIYYMAYGRLKLIIMKLFECIWQLVDHLPYAYVEKHSLAYGRKEVPFAT